MDKLDIVVSINEITLGDVEKLLDPDQSKVSFGERLDILQRLVTNGVDIRTLKLGDLKTLMKTVEEALEAEVNPLTPEGSPLGRGR